MKYLLPSLVGLAFAQVSHAQVVDRSSLTNKIVCGYQGWFACAGDGNHPNVGWSHWSQADYVGPGVYNIDVWPDPTEYNAEDLYACPQVTLTSGAPAYLFSSRKQGVTNVHFRWMQENSIDGIWLQRFSGGLGNPSSPNNMHKDAVLQNVMNAATTYGRTFCIEYDLSGTDDSVLFDKLTTDWAYLNSQFGVSSHSRYQYHNGKPVVILWGLVHDRPYQTTTAMQVINWFKDAGCFLIAGVGGNWRSAPEPWASVYRSYHGISPWSVGGYNSWTEIAGWRDNIWGPDIADCNAHGMIYVPVAWPRFGWDNANHLACGTSKFSPRGGQHFWDQFYAQKSAGTTVQKIAMFDECDESTAILKMSNDIPTTGCFWTTEGLPNDWWLRLANYGGKMLRGEIPLSQTMPISPTSSPDNSTNVSHTIPFTIYTGRQYNVIITVRNTGETCWNSEMFKLGAVDDSDPFAASTRSVMAPGTTILPNQQYSFRVAMTAPMTTGTYTTDWRMVHELIRWFGSTTSRNVTVSSASDTTGPSSVSGFAATPGDLRTILTWTNPTTADFSAVMIRYKTTGYPTSTSDGTLVVDKAGLPGALDTYSHDGLVNGVAYYYSAFSHDVIPNYSTRVSATATPANIEPPALVTQFAVSPGVNKNDLSWTNPTNGDFTGTMIRYRTDTYPTSPTDGSPVCDRTTLPGSSDGYSHIGLLNGTTYYYSAFTYDNVPNYSAAATTSGTPLGAREYINRSTFTFSSEGWTTSNWKAGSGSNGVMTLSGSAMRCTGGDYTDNNDRCQREGGEIQKTIPTTGYEKISISYDVRVNSLGSEMTGAGTGACTVDHGLIDEQLAVFYSINGGTSWTEAEWIKRADLLAGYQTYGTRTVDLSTLASCNDNPNFRLRFRWQLNTASDAGDLDNIFVMGNALGPPDTTPPAQVTSFSATPSGSQVNIGWRNPNDNDCAGTIVRFKTSGYPTNVTDGNLLCNKANFAGTFDSYIHTGLTDGITYYYSGFAYDEVPNYSVKTDATAMLADTTPPGPVTGFSLVVGNERNNLMWSNPTDSDFAGVKILFKTTGYPASSTDGTPIYNSSGSSYTHTGVTNDVTYYYSAFAYDGAPNYSAKADATGIPIYVDAKAVKLAPINTAITLTHGVISAAFTDFFYVQSPDADRPLFGIRVNKPAHGLAEGSLVGATGTAVTDDATGEKYLSATWAGTSVTAAVSAKSMANASVGGVDWNYNDSNKAGQKGVEGAIGPNNIGMLVRVWGRVTQRQASGPTKYFYISDGSDASDGTQTDGAPNKGIRVLADPAGHETDEYVAVTGVVSCFKDSVGNIRRLILPKMIHEL